MKLMKMDVSQAAGILGLRIMKYAGVTHFVYETFVEATVADADKAIAESQEALALAEQSPLVGGTQYWHLKNISAWTVIKSQLKTEEN